MGSTEQMFHPVIEVDANLKTSRGKDTYTQHTQVKGQGVAARSPALQCQRVHGLE